MSTRFIPLLSSTTRSLTRTSSRLLAPLSLQSNLEIPSARLLQLTSHLRTSPTFQIRKMTTSIPQTMKGVLIEKTGGVEVLDYRTDLPVPTPKEGELLAKNEFVGVNYIDT